MPAHSDSLLHARLPLNWCGVIEGRACLAHGILEGVPELAVVLTTRVQSRGSAP